MESRSELLLKCGFIKETNKGNYVLNEETKIWEPKSGYSYNSKDAEEEITEIGFTEKPEYFETTGFPQPKKAWHLLWEVYDLSIEEPYFWVLREFQNDFPVIEKLEDSFAAAENSAFFGITQVRLGSQQEKVSQFLATTGKMIKELFQMVRELRIIDERLDYYREAQKQLARPLRERSKSAEITLKGLFVDLVQGGGKNPGSIFGMARELEFITLPDLFFDAPPFNSIEELDAHLKSLEKDFNQSVLRVLQRHLRQFLEWKKRTTQEHESRRRFMLQYLLQHFEIIKMYINWVKPYLRHVARLTMKEKNLKAPDLISAFEGSMLDMELLAHRKKEINGEEYHGCCLATFNYRTHPDMKVVQEGYQRGPVHIGKFEMWLRLYIWNKKQVEAYKQLKELEAIALLGDVSESVRKAMESLGTELDRYLNEARNTEEKKKETAPSGKKTFLQKFFGDFYSVNKPKSASKPAAKPHKKLGADEIAAQKKELLGMTQRLVWKTYKNFKKAHRLIQF